MKMTTMMTMTKKSAESHLCSDKTADEVKAFDTMTVETAALFPKQARRLLSGETRCVRVKFRLW